MPADPRDWEINPEALLRVRTNIAAVAAQADDTDQDPDDVDPMDQDGTDTGDAGEELEEEIPAGDRGWTETPVNVGAG